MTTATQTQIRRDTAANLTAATPAAGELGFDLTNKRIVAGDGVTPGGIMHSSAKDIQNQSFAYATVGGTANAITLTNNPVVAAYTSPLKQCFKATGTNTTAVTVDVDTLGTKNVKKMLDGALANLAAGDIVSGGYYEIVYDGTQFQIKGLGTATQTPGGFVYLGTRTASSSATIDFNSLIGSTYDDYVIKFDNVVPATNAADLLMRMSVDNGSSFDSGSGDYRYALSLNDAVSGASTSNGSSATSLKVASSISNGAALGVSGEVKLFNVNSSTSRKMVIGDSAYVGSAGGTHMVRGSLGGLRDKDEAVINALRFLMSAGDIASGVFRLYGIAKS